MLAIGKSPEREAEFSSSCRSTSLARIFHPRFKPGAAWDP
jgi:hypothetical protein